MNILGITGLGVDPAACLVRDGKLVAMAQEERFNRIKGSFGLLPARATAFCLRHAGLTLDRIDRVAFAWDARKYPLYMACFFLGTWAARSPKGRGGGNNSGRALDEILKYRPGKVKAALAAMFRDAGLTGRLPPVDFIPHHHSHAAAAFYCSGFNTAHILVIDGSGEDRCTSIFRGEDRRLAEISRVRIPDSLGWFYQSVTEFLGFIPNRDESKVMGLAAYGERDPRVRALFDRIIRFDAAGRYRYDARYGFLGAHSRGGVYSDEMERLLGSPRLRGEPLEKRHRDIAFCAQEILEEIVVAMMAGIARLPGYNGNVCVSGGVGLNCKMNGRIAALEGVRRLYVPPVSDDAGSALGAALLSAGKHGDDPRAALRSPYWGPAFTEEEIRGALETHGLEFTREKDIAVAAARLLAQGKVVAWFQGRMEAGPRALGNRSLLAAPFPAGMKDRVNGIKGREPWRPFAPSLLAESAGEYLRQRADEGLFMTCACGVTEKAAREIPAVVHTDGTTRPHLVREELNPRYRGLIRAFGEMTGVPVVLNTSFNIGPEPIVCTPGDAARSFAGSGIEFLAIGDFLVSK